MFLQSITLETDSTLFFMNTPQLAAGMGGFSVTKQGILT
jgi:hypothetical protein